MGVESLGKKICTRVFFYIYTEKLAWDIEKQANKDLEMKSFLYI
jgi:hypothetical protein